MDWTVPALLGAYHGLNPAMGWLFAVALGLQHRRVSRVLSALPAIAVGHAASVALVLAAAVGAGTLLPAGLLRIVGACVLFAFGGWLLLRRRSHPRWVGMRVGLKELAWWSFLMSTAHGAGLMLLPVVTTGTHVHAGSHHHLGHAVQGGIAAFGAHTAAMFLAMSVAALIVYEVLGVEFLRRGWVNLDGVWAGAMFVAGAATLLIR
jgi:hypothetical protein